MLEVFIVAATTIFATMGPVDVAAVYAGMTPHNTPGERRSMAIKGVLIATAILLIFAFFGNAILQQLGISLSALRIAGGILLLLISIEMVFARHSGGHSTTEDEDNEAANKSDVSVFPLATPLIAGAGTMGAVILLMAEAANNTDLDPYVAEAMVVAAILFNLILTLVLLLVATLISKLLGVTGLNVVIRVTGVLLAALAVQFMIDGLVSTNLFGA